MKTGWIALCLMYCFVAPPSVSAESLTFGVYTSDKPTAMYRTFNPIITYLESYLEKRGLDVEISIKIYPSYDGAITALAEGAFDFGRFGPASYILARERNNGIKLICMEHKNGKKRFKGIFIARSDNSAINQLQDLRGKTFAFGDRNSTIGRYLSQAELLKQGISSSDLQGYTYLGRHDKVALAVAAGNYDGGVVKENTFKKYQQTAGLKLIGEFPNVTKPWVARAGMDDTVFGALREGMLALDSKEILKNLKQHGFLPASDDDYDFVRQGMALSREAFE